MRIQHLRTVIWQILSLVWVLISVQTLKVNVKYGLECCIYWLCKPGCPPLPPLRKFTTIISYDNSLDLNPKNNFTHYAIPVVVLVQCNKLFILLSWAVQGETFFFSLFTKWCGRQHWHYLLRIWNILIRCSFWWPENRGFFNVTTIDYKKLLCLH